MWYAILIIIFVAAVYLVAYALCRIAREADDDMERMERAMRVSRNGEYLSDYAKGEKGNKV